MGEEKWDAAGVLQPLEAVALLGIELVKELLEFISGDHGLGEVVLAELVSELDLCGLLFQRTQVDQFRDAFFEVVLVVAVGRLVGVENGGLEGLLHRFFDLLKGLNELLLVHVIEVFSRVERLRDGQET